MGFNLSRTNNIVDKTISKKPKYKLNESISNPLFNQAPNIVPGALPIKKINPLMKSTCFDLIYEIVEDKPMKIIMITDKPTTRCGVMSGKKPKLIPKKSVTGIKITPPPNPTNEPNIPAQSAMMEEVNIPLKFPFKKI